MLVGSQVEGNIALHLTDQLKDIDIDSSRFHELKLTSSNTDLITSIV